MMSPNRLAGWLGRTFVPDAEYRLLYVASDSDLQVVFLWPSDSVKNEGAWELAFAEIVLLTCQDHCDDVEQPASYRLQISRDEKVYAEKKIRREPDRDSPDPLGIDSTVTTSATGQLVRVIEGYLRIHVGLIKTMQDGYRSLLSDQREEIKSLRRREEKATDFVFEVLSATSDDEGTNHQAMDKLSGLAEKLAPLLIERIGGARDASG